jgi:hypothetical protein
VLLNFTRSLGSFRRRSAEGGRRNGAPNDTGEGDDREHVRIISMNCDAIT